MRGQIQDFENKSENSEEMKNWSLRMLYAHCVFNKVLLK